MLVSRRQALRIGGAATIAALGSTLPAAEPTAERTTRGVVLYPFDLSLADWPERAAKAGLNTIGLHAAQRFDVLADFVHSAAGDRFFADCKKLDIAVEYELHAMGELLSRELYYKDPTLFRVDGTGRRNPDANCNPFSATALDIIAEKAVQCAQRFKSDTGRYFYWPDDGGKWDESPQAKEMNASDQALLVENYILKALRRHVDPKATLAHICYHETMEPPRLVKPTDGVFLEFAPIDRDAKIAAKLAALAANMRIFGARSSQVLDYWLDVSLYSGWRRPAVKLPWNEQDCRADVAAYRKMGVRHITTFATYIDADYVRRNGDPQPVIEAYGKILRQS